jgi:hypothetical protein
MGFKPIERERERSHAGFALHRTARPGATFAFHSKGGVCLSSLFRPAFVTRFHATKSVYDRVG